MKIVFTQTALAEVVEILSYIEKHNAKAASDVAAAIQRTVAFIARRPKLAPLVFEDRVRAKLVERYQYRFFFEVQGDTVIVRNVRSTKQRRPWEK